MNGYGSSLLLVCGGFNFYELSTAPRENGKGAGVGRGGGGG